MVGSVSFKTTLSLIQYENLQVHAGLKAEVEFIISWFYDWILNGRQE